MAHAYKARKTDKVWRFEYRDRLKRKKRGRGTPSKAETERIAFELESRERAIRQGWVEEPNPNLRPHPYDKIAAEYLDWGDTQGGRGGRPWGERHSLSRHRHMAWWGERLKLKSQCDLIGCLPRAEAAS